MTNQEAKKAWAEGKKLEWRLTMWDEGSWRAFSDTNPLNIFDNPNYLFRIVPEPVVLECVVGNELCNKAIYRDKTFVAYCRDFGIDPPLGTRVKLTVEVE